MINNWHVPQALQGGIWATIPGSGPSDVDPWSLLENAGTQGADSGVRVAFAIGALLSNNAGETDKIKRSLEGHGQSLDVQRANPSWLFFDQYATEVSLFQSDLLWTSEMGYRSPKLGVLPQVPTSPVEPATDDPFRQGIQATEWTILLVNDINSTDSSSILSHQGRK